MYIVNGIAYAGEREQEPSVREVKPLDDLMQRSYWLILRFSR